MVDYNEPGELIGKIVEDNLLREFTGYKGLPSETRKKVLTDVFIRGDKYFHSSDILKMDEEGGALSLLYRQDR